MAAALSPASTLPSNESPSPPEPTCSDDDGGGGGGGDVPREGWLLHEERSQDGSMDGKRRWKMERGKRRRVAKS